MRFLVTGLPRCRTAWFAAYLTEGDTICFHEAYHNNVDLQVPFKNKGNSEPSVPQKWIDEFEPQKIVIVHRDLGDVYRSLKQMGIAPSVQWLQDLEARNQEMDGLHVDYHNIDLENVHDYLGFGNYNPHRAALYNKMHIQHMNWRR